MIALITGEHSNSSPLQRPQREGSRGHSVEILQDGALTSIGDYVIKVNRTLEIEIKLVWYYLLALGMIYYCLTNFLIDQLLD